MPTQNDTQSQIALSRKINFAIQLLRESAELLDIESPKTTFSMKRSRYTRRSSERDE